MNTQYVGMPYYHPPMNMTLGQKIKYHRKYLGIKQQEMAELVGVSRQILQKYESDIHDPPFFIISCIAKVLGVSLDYLAWG